MAKGDDLWDDQPILGSRPIGGWRRPRPRWISAIPFLIALAPLARGESTLAETAILLAAAALCAWAINAAARGLTSRRRQNRGD